MFKMTLAVREVAAFEDLPVGAAFRVRFLPSCVFFKTSVSTYGTAEDQALWSWDFGSTGCERIEIVEEEAA
jgi:hypothetical protein